MFRSLSSTKSAVRALLGASIVLAAATFVRAPADAHFILQTPAASITQDGLGNPQKLGPCGNESGGSATGEVTTFQAGQTITITIDETIFHPGHYRISLGTNGPGDLPDEPPVTAGNTPCGSTEIMDPPVFPVLADGVLLHDAPFNGPQTIQVTLPANVSCEKCTLQVLEFMSNHQLNNPGGCFYHHCADIKISGGGGTGGTGGTAGAGGATGGTAGTTATTTSASGGGGGAGGGAGGGGAGAGGPGSSGGCGCAIPGGDASSFGALATLLGLAMLRRRRRS